MESQVGRGTLSLTVKRPASQKESPSSLLPLHFPVLPPWWVGLVEVTKGNPASLVSMSDSCLTTLVLLMVFLTDSWGLLCTYPIKPCLSLAFLHGHLLRYWCSKFPYLCLISNVSLLTVSDGIIRPVRPWLSAAWSSKLHMSSPMMCVSSTSQVSMSPESHFTLLSNRSAFPPAWKMNIDRVPWVIPGSLPLQHTLCPADTK